MTVHLIDGVFVCDAPTIIEADEESEEVNEIDGGESYGDSTGQTEV